MSANNVCFPGSLLLAPTTMALWELPQPWESCASEGSVRVITPLLLVEMSGSATLPHTVLSGCVGISEYEFLWNEMFMVRSFSNTPL